MYTEAVQTKPFCIQKHQEQNSGASWCAFKTCFNAMHETLKEKRTHTTVVKKIMLHKIKIKLQPTNKQNHRWTQ